jgi:hypothetical protein
MSLNARFFFISLLAVSIAACASTMQGDKLAAALEGAWCNSEDGGKTCWAFEDFASGAATSCGQSLEDGTKFLIKGNYTIRGDLVCHEATASNVSSMAKPGDRFCVQIVHIDEKTQQYRFSPHDEIHTLHRIPREDIRCPVPDTPEENAAPATDAGEQ